MTRLFTKIQHYHAALGSRGVLWFVWAKVSGRQPLYRARIPGIRHDVAVRIGTTDASVLRQVLRECQYDAPLPESPRRIVDAGANIGLASVFFANKYPDAEIVALEPDASNFQVLLENVKSYPNIRPIHGALWRQDGELELIDPGSGHHGFRTAVVGSSTVSTLKVPAFTVASLMERMNWDQVDLLKVDIEGAEKEVFESSGSWISRVGACMVELHDAIKPGCVDAFDRATHEFAGRTTRGESLITWRVRTS